MVALLGFALAAGAALTAPGKIQGVVRFTGVVPPPQEIMTTEGLRITHHDLVVDGKTKGLRFVAAVLEDAPAQPKVEKSAPVLMDQRNMVFVPRVIAVQHGQAVRFENNDGSNHSVMAHSTVAANQLNTFVNGDKPLVHVFAPQKHPVAIGCALHAWMKAWVYVVPHPWFAVTDAQGTFTIANVPPGTYQLWLRHPDTGLHERRAVTVLAGKTTDVVVEWKKAAP